MDDNDQIVYERQPKNAVSQRRRNQRHSLNANDTLVRKQIVTAIELLLVQRQQYMECLFFMLILDSDGSSTNDDHEDDEEDDYFLIMIHIYEYINTSICYLVDQYWNLFGVTERVYNQLPPNPPKMNRTIDEFGDDTDEEGDLLMQLTNFNKPMMKQLYELFFEEEEFESGFVYIKGHKISLEFSLLIGMMYMKGGEKFIVLQSFFGGETTVFSHAIGFLYNHLYSKYFHKICGQSYKMYTQDTHLFREAIYRSCFESRLDNYPFEDHRIFAFVDAKSHESCRPGGSGQADTRDERDVLNALQQAFYTHYGKLHGLRVQSITLPNGMFGNIFVATAAQNDRGLLNISGIQEAYQALFDEHQIYVRGQYYPALAGDDTYNHSLIVVRSYGGQNDGFRECFKSARVKIEHHFGYVMSLWRLLMKFYLHRIIDRNKFQKRLVVAHFLTNCKSCFEGNTVATAFGCQTPNIEEYLAGPHEYYYD